MANKHKPLNLYSTTDLLMVRDALALQIEQDAAHAKNERKPTRTMPHALRRWAEQQAMANDVIRLHKRFERAIAARKATTAAATGDA